MPRTNEHGQEVGDPVEDWTPATAPTPTRLSGRWVDLEPLALEHADDLHAALCGADRASLWTYLGDAMPASRADLASYLDRRLADRTLASVVIRPHGGPVLGVASWMRADPANGTVEVGSIALGPALQRTTAATEAMWLMARHAFDLGHRRYEWKCDALNAPSRAAALRLGFTYEGTFRQASVTKGRNRDTAWFSLTDDDWQRLAPAYERWLDPANFDDPATGEGQRASLSALTRV